MQDNKDEKERLAREELDAELLEAYIKARKGKRATHDEADFEINQFLLLSMIADALWKGTYKPSRSIVHIIFKPVIREIFAAKFIDRIVHHFVFANLEDYCERHFIYDSYSCRKGKGTLFGIQRLDHHTRSVSRNFKIKTYVIKMDIQGYFMSISREILNEVVQEWLKEAFSKDLKGWKYQILKKTIREIIMDDPVKGAVRNSPMSDWRKLPKSKSLYNQRPGVGIVIGNLTSQLFSNIYLDALDKFVMYRLEYKHYGRYVDDFYIVVTEEGLPKAKKDIEKIRMFLKNNLGLTLHQKKTKIQEISKGVEFLGAVIYPYRIVCGKRLIRNINEALAQIRKGERAEGTLQSYAGYVMHFKSFRTMVRLLHRQGFFI